MTRRPTSHYRRPETRRNLPAVECLEDRLALDATSSLHPSGAIVIQGTALDDYVRVTQNGGTITVTCQTSVLPARSYNYDASQVSAINFYGYGRHDTFYNETAISSFAVLGSGNDTFFAGHGNDVILCGSGDDMGTGGLGNDSILGEGGDDCLRGFMGNDTISGGAGWDELYGEWGNDLLFGGSGDRDQLHGHDYLYGGDGRDVLEAGYNDMGDNYTSDVLYGNDSEYYAYQDVFILSNGSYRSNGDYVPTDFVGDRCPEDLVYGFGRFRSAEDEFRTTGKIGGVYYGGAALDEQALLDAPDLILPQLDPAAEVTFVESDPINEITDDLLLSASADYSLGEEAPLVEAGPDVLDLVSIDGTLDEEQVVDPADALEPQIDVFATDPLESELDMTAVLESDSVSYTEAAEAPAVELSAQSITTKVSYTDAYFSANRLGSFKFSAW
jgi:Ca2+-binding RTX toxin-like protein